jgi:hypothetical protein
MRGQEIVRSINERRSMDHSFVKWWRKEEDFLDYDLIDRYVENVSNTEEIGGIDLLTMDEMFGELKRVSEDRVRVIHGETVDNVEWVHKGKGGGQTERCMYTPETLLTIFDVETRGNPVDS